MGRLDGGCPVCSWGLPGKKRDLSLAELQEVEGCGAAGHGLGGRCAAGCGAAEESSSCSSQNGGELAEPQPY